LQNTNIFKFRSFTHCPIVIQQLTRSGLTPVAKSVKYDVRWVLAYAFLVVAGLPVSDANAGVMISDVTTAGGDNALAAIGPFDGNDEQGGGATGEGILNSASGDSFDVALGFDADWKWLGSTSGSGTGITSTDLKNTSGSLSLTSPITGPFVVSLKAGNKVAKGGGFVFYLFNSSQEISSLNFLTQALSSKGLSHASLYLSSTPATLTPGTVPEPATMAIWLVIVVCGMETVRRKRFKLA
tara:strand:+ start:1022 stop:1741 length:720 start_codon:yes stop_codon:yes gene_type:complete